MEIAFYSCHACGKVREEQQIRKDINCRKCGCRKFHPVYLNGLRVWLFVITHPSYLIAAIKGGAR